MCGNYSREETIQGRKLYEEIRYLFFWITNIYWTLFLSAFDHCALSLCNSTSFISNCWFSALSQIFAGIDGFSSMLLVAVSFLDPFTLCDWIHFLSFFFSWENENLLFSVPSFFLACSHSGELTKATTPWVTKVFVGRLVISHVSNRV